MDEMSRKSFLTDLDIALKHLAIILRYTDECSDIGCFTIDSEPFCNSGGVSITAYFQDGGVKHISADADMFDIFREVIDEITGPRDYNMDKDEIAETLADLRDTYSKQLNGKEKSAINSAIKLITDPDYLKED